MVASAQNSAFLGVEKSITGRTWRPRLSDDRVALAISQRLGVPDVIGRLLGARGIGPDDAEEFLNPTLRTGLTDPSLLKDMDAAAERIATAINGNEQVAVFGDYDVDGATSSAILKRFFRALGRDLRIYIPDRIAEGYGPNTPALLRLAEEGIGLVITVDCGTLSYDPLAAAAKAGLDVIVADHHMAEPALPDAYAVVNPNRLDDTSGVRQLAAVGVVFLLIVAVNRYLRANGFYNREGIDEPNLLQWLDLVALGTICDVVPLTGVNRALVRQGLKVMASRRNPGLKALGDVADLDRAPTPYHAGFVFGPRVNAGGRVGEARLGALLLATDDPNEAAAIAAKLDRYNNERRAIESMVLEDAQNQVEDTGTPGAIVFTASRGWHPGVIGIVASRLKDAYDRPAVVIALGDDGIGKGSGRSVPGVDLGAAVTAASQAGLLESGGGHVMAAGLTVREERLGALREFLEDRVARQRVETPARAALDIDAALSVGGANLEMLEVLEKAGPYGSGNPEPRFVLPGVRISYAAQAGDAHVRCTLESDDGRRLNGIAFQALSKPLGDALLGAGDKPLHIAGHIRSNTWKGRTRPQLVIEDAAVPVDRTAL